MATQTRAPTSEISVTGTWSGTSRHLLLDDHPDSGNPIADGTTCSAAGVLAMGFTAFSIPAGSTGISVQVLYYDFKNGSQAATNGALIRCNDTTDRLSATHNPGNGNANIALRTLDYTTNPKSAAAWTVDDVNGVGTNGLTAFGISVTDANPTSTISSALLQVTYTEPITGTGALNAQSSDITGSGTVQWVATGAMAAQAADITGSGITQWAATGVLAAQSADITGAGDVTGGNITGTGVLNSQSATIISSGVSASVGSGILAVGSAVLAGVGIIQWIAVGILTAGFAAMDGSGTVTGGGGGLSGRIIGWLRRRRRQSQ